MSSFFEKLKEGKSKEVKTPERKREKFFKVIEEENKKPSALFKEKQIKKNDKVEGQLSIDVYETDKDFIIQSTIAGVKTEDLDISIDNDIVTIRGNRRRTEEKEIKNYFYQECYWGSFSRQLILPEEVDEKRAKATMKDGVLTLRIPKIGKEKRKKITVKGEE